MTEEREQGQASETVTLNGVPMAEIEHHARRLHELLCQANLIQGKGATCSFNGWTADGRPVRHTVKVEGYVRIGPRVEAERIARAKA